MSIEALTEIARHNHHGWAYVGTRLKAGEAVIAALKAHGPPPEPVQPWRPSIAWIIGIPIDIDPDLGRDEWRLVDPASGAVLREGRVA
jgi:hypothetical protein